MRRYAFKRILLGLLTVVGVFIIVFVISRLSGDVTYLLMPEDATAEEEALLRSELGLDKSIPIQLIIFMKEAVTGNFGMSIRYNRPAIIVVFKRLPATCELALAAFLLSVFMGLPIGVISATKRGSLLDTFGKVFALVGQSMPGFWLGIMAIIAFSVYLGWLPTSGRGGIQYLVLPATTLAWYGKKNGVVLNSTDCRVFAPFCNACAGESRCASLEYRR